MGLISQNVRFLLWREGVPSSSWKEVLRADLGWADGEVDRVLCGNALGPVQLGQLAERFQRSEEELVYEDLLSVEEVDVLQQNLTLLAGGMAHGSKKQLAEALGVGPVSVSRWLTGKHRPPADKLVELVSYFGLMPGTDLRTVPLFLELGPISSFQRRGWLHERIESISAEELQDLFPALKRLLAPSR